MFIRATQRKTNLALLVLLLAALVPSALAQSDGTTLRIGVVLDQTGPASALGVGEVNTLALMQRMFDEQGGIAGFAVELTLIDSGSTVAGAVTAVDELLSENRLHALVCCTLSSSSQAIVAPAQAANVPTITLAAAAPLASPAAQRRWMFQAAQSDSLMIRGILADLQSRSITNITVMVLSDVFGESGLVEMQQAFEGASIRIDKVVRYDRDAESFVAPALAAVLDRPQAVVVWGIAEDSARMVRALRERQFGGEIYLSHGVGSPTFLELAGSAAEGVRLPMGPVLVASQLAANHPSRQAAEEYTAAYEAAYGSGSVTSFGGHMYDALRLLEQAVLFANDRGALDPGDVTATRNALRSALEEMPAYNGVGGVFDYSSTDHTGLDARAMVMVEVSGGTWQLAQ